MPSEQARAITERLAALQTEIMGSGTRPSLAEQRQAVELFGTMGTERAGVEVTEVVAGARPGLWHAPGGGGGSAVLLHFHGGGLCMGSAGAWSRLAAHLAAEADATVLNLEFRLAPEHPFPASLDDAHSAYEWLLAEGHRPDDIYLGGDSAGSSLALGTAQALRDVGGPLPAGVYLLSPWIDFTLTNRSLTELAGADVLTTMAALEMMQQFYLPGGDATDPRISPGLGDMTGLPRLHIEASRDEVLLDDAVALSEAAGRAGVEVDLRLWEGVPHVHQLFVGNLPEADESVRLIADWVRAGG
jgi:acetyl esterase/lipase